MHQRQRRFETRVGQVLVVGAELLHEHHALVDDGAAGHRHRVIFGDSCVAHLIGAGRDHLADEEDAALEGVLVLGADAAGDEHLTMHRLDRLDPRAEVGIVDGHVAPTDELLPLGDDRLLDEVFHGGARFGIARHEELADCVMSGLRQAEAELLAFLREEDVRDLGQHAAAVAERRVRAGGAAMIEIDQDLQPLLDDRMALAVVEIGDEADAAGIVLVGGVVEADRTGKGGVRAERSRLVDHLTTPLSDLERAFRPRLAIEFSGCLMQMLCAGQRAATARSDSGAAFGFGVSRRLQHDRPASASQPRGNSARMGQQDCPISEKMPETAAAHKAP